MRHVARSDVRLIMAHERVERVARPDDLERKPLCALSGSLGAYEDGKGSAPP